MLTDYEIEFLRIEAMSPGGLDVVWAERIRQLVGTVKELYEERDTIATIRKTDSGEVWYVPDTDNFIIRRTYIEGPLGLMGVRDFNETFREIGWTYVGEL